MNEPLLQIVDLDVSFATPDGPVQAVKGLSFSLGAGETLGIVGESGSGKSQTVLATMGLLADNGRASGEVIFSGQSVLNLPVSAMNRIRGTRIAMIFQDPMTSLNPFLTLGRQMSEVLCQHQGKSRRDALRECERMLDAVHIADSRRRLGMYPHELSGGMRQRVMIATALLCRPILLIADEPTTALDVTVQAQILALLKELRAEFDTSIILITHDLGVVAGICEQVLVMREGMAIEHGPVDRVFHSPADAYTRSLLEAVPRLDDMRLRGPVECELLKDASNQRQPVLTVDGLKVHFKVPAPRPFGSAQTLRAVDGINLELQAGETLGVVGESGCGKSTLARAVLRLVPVAAGRVCLLGKDISHLEQRSLKESRRNMQIIFQDPFAALNPRMTVREIVAEPLQTFHDDLSKTDVSGRVEDILEKVGLERSHMSRYPHEFSGGQCQRIAIARALILQPRLIICDEPVSALDVSIRAQIINLLIELQTSLGLALIFITHDLAVVRQMSHRIMVMYLGRVVEVADQYQLYENPGHPYTRALINAIPVPDPRVERGRVGTTLEGDVPSPLDPPTGCAFRTRCIHATVECAERVPKLERRGSSMVACHHSGKI